MVSVLAFYSDDPSLNPAEVYNFSVKLLLKRTKINKKEAGVGPFFKEYYILMRFVNTWINQRTLTVGGSITLQLVSTLTDLDSVALPHTNNNIFSCFVKSKLETSS